ncbi:MAG TPA: hypothetical protein VH300_16060 [Thermoleophilaceae bacterium]|jgi:hypothetical protein|nr:hypothetical protein [Thermoleophilaceae bacterium]
MRVTARTAVVLTAAALAGCGGGASSNSTGTSAAAQGRAAGGLFAQLTTSQRECLQKAGLTQPPAGGRPRSGTRGGGRPPSPGGGQQFQARRQKMQAAFQKCGIKLPSRPPTAPGAQNN